MEKNNFILYKDQRPLIEKLSDEQAGKLLKGIYHYVCGDGIPQDLDSMTDLVFTSIQTTLHRDLVKYREMCAKRSKASNKRWNPNDTNEYESMQMDTNVCKSIDLNANECDRDRDRESDRDRDIYIVVVNKFKNQVVDEVNRLSELEELIYPNKKGVKENAYVSLDSLLDMFKTYSYEELQTINNLKKGDSKKIIRLWLEANKVIEREEDDETIRPKDIESYIRGIIRNKGDIKR